MKTDATGQLRHSRRDSVNDDVKRAVLRDCRLSWAARGFFSLLYTLPDRWNFRFSHLLQMGPGGKTQLQGVVLELKVAGGLIVDDKRLDVEEAERLNAALQADGKPMKYRSGMLAGKVWTVVHPDDWAVEFPLNPSDHDQQLLRTFADRLAAAKATGHRRTENPPSVKPTSEKPPVRDSRESKLLTSLKEEEHSGAAGVDKFVAGLGLLLKNEQDRHTCRQLEEEFADRRDLLFNAIALIRAQREKNLPFPSTVLKKARVLRADEKYQNMLNRA